MALSRAASENTKARVVTAWLSHYLCCLVKGLPDNPELSKMCACLRLSLICSFFRGFHLDVDLPKPRYNLAEWLNVCERNGQYLSPDVARHLMALSDRSMHAYLELGERAMHERKYLWPARPKLHVPGWKSVFSTITTSREDLRLGKNWRTAKFLMDAWIRAPR